MASEIGIYNMAISHLGQGQEVSERTEDSEAAAACRRFYEQARDEVLRDYSWPFATAFATLGLVETDPTTEWSYSYRVPSNCLKVRRIPSGTRTDTRETAVPYRLGRDAQGKLVYTDQADAELEYTVRVTDPGEFPPDFTSALSMLLASYIAPRVTAGDPNGLGKRALQFYMAQISKAAGNAFNEEVPDIEPDSIFVEGR